MKKLKISQSFSTGLVDFFDKDIATIGFEDIHFGEGGFGVVYKVEKIDQQIPPLPLVIKLFIRRKEKNFETVFRLQCLVRKEAQNLQEQNVLFFDKYPSLIALPLLSFEGMLDGNSVCGYLSINLEELGFVASNYILMDCLKKNPEDWSRFQCRSLYVKYKMAYYFAESCAFLRKIHFIHADITPDNIFIHKHEPLCALIDYDSGAIIDSNSDLPTTDGKHYADWTPPEMVADSAKKRLTAAVDDWAFTIALHYIFTGYQAFFTKDMSPKTIELFNEMYLDGSLVWPDISNDSKYKSLFDDDHLAAQTEYRKYYDRLDERIKRGFEYTFSRGAYRLSLRHDAKWWISVLDKSIQNCSFQVNIKWDKLKAYIKDFPDIQSKKEYVAPKEWISRMVFLKDNTKNEVKLSPPQVSSHKKEHNTQSFKSSFLPSSSQKSKQFMDPELLSDLISGNVSFDMYKGMISKIAKDNGYDGELYLENLKDFVKLFKDSVKDKIISKLEYSILILQGKTLGIEQNTINRLIKPYKRM